MTKKALIIDGFAVNVVDADNLATSFHPNVAKDFVTVPDNVRQGQRLVDGAWIDPPPIEPLVQGD